MRSSVSITVGIVNCLVFQVSLGAARYLGEKCARIFTLMAILVQATDFELLSRLGANETIPAIGVGDVIWVIDVGAASSSLLILFVRLLT